MMGNKPQEEKRPRGRPRKNPLCPETNKRPRGRPRKNSNFNCAQLRDLEKQQKKEIENDKEKEKQVAEKDNEQDKEEAEKDNVEDKEEAEKENVEDKEEAEKENVEDKEEAEKENVEETEEAEKEKDNEGSSESVRDGVRASIFDSPAETKNRSRGRPRKNLHCAETKKGLRGRPRKNLNIDSARLRDLENQKQIETGKEREEDAEEKEKEVAEIENEEEKAEAEKENEEEEKEKEEVDTEFTAQEMIRDGVKKRGRGRPRKMLHCAEMGKRPPGRPRKNLNCAKLRDLEKQKEVENDNEREEDMEENADEEDKENVEEEEIEIEIEIEKENEEAKEKVKEGTAEFAGETKRDGVRVSIFEYSAESYFHDIDAIASVCGTDDEESFEPHVIQRFSTAITFLREWKHFYYEPKTIRCAFETGSPHEKDVNAEISLPQFSAANVPKKQSSDKRFGSSSNDFVLHVGGQVWGLDWCPRNHQPECHTKCEYLAISVHPPDSSYHKMGAPLIGRGIIQIWCILNAEEEEAAPSEPKRRRGRPRLVRTEEAAPSEPKRKRGRPRLVRTEGDELETKACKGLSHGVLLPCKLGSSTGKRKRRIKDDERAGVCNGNLLIDNVDNSIIQVSDCHDDVLMASNQREAHHGSLRTSMTSSVLAKDVTLPRLVLCLAHNAKVAWDVKWRPYSANDPEYKHRMGYLAVLLGNGSLEVWEVPLPKMIKILYTSIHKVGTDPRFVKLEPAFRSSKVMCGDRQSIPLTVEWSTSAPHNMLLAGCHDGTLSGWWPLLSLMSSLLADSSYLVGGHCCQNPTICILSSKVAMWKFSASSSPEDARPLLCFTADTVPIRALAWAPDGSDAESANLIVTAGHEGLRFWDIRDPYRPLWDLNPVRRVLSLDWLHDPRCLILSVDDGTLRLLSLSKAAYDVPVTGIPFVGTNLQGFHTFCCSSFSIWSVHVSRFTGQVAYCGADGSALHFQLTTKVVEKEPSRYKEPHFLCGSLTIEDSTLTINTPLPNVPCPMKKFLSESLVHAKGQPDQTPGDTKLLLPSMKVQKPKDCRNKKDNRKWLVVGEVREQQNATSTVDLRELKRQLEVLPPKMVSLHRVRWNRNKGSQRLLCYGGAAGIVRCQVIRK